MSFETILIHRDLPVIDRRVVKPPVDPVQFTDIDNVTFGTATDVYLSQGSGRQTGSAFGQQEFVRLEGIRPDEWYATDPLTGL